MRGSRRLGAGMSRTSEGAQQTAAHRRQCAEESAPKRHELLPLVGKAWSIARLAAQHHGIVAADKSAQLTETLRAATGAQQYERVMFRGAPELSG